MIFAGLVFVLGIPGVSQGASALPGDDVVALHQGSPHGGQFERHQLHHGMGRGGRGICPQKRVTLKAPDQVYDSKNPLQPTLENLAEGESLFHYKAQPTVCKVCHGANGNGLGMMAQGLRPMPRNFTCKETMDKIPDGQMFWIIKNGTPSAAMPPYQLFLSGKQIWQLILYIRTLSYEEPGFLP